MRRHYSRNNRRTREKQGNRYYSVILLAGVVLLIGGVTLLYQYHRTPEKFPRMEAFSARVNAWWVERKARIGNKLADSHEKMNKVASTVKAKPSPPESLHFEFYSMLPNGGGSTAPAEESVPIFSHDSLERELAQEMKKSAFIIQTGIYSNVASADKAREMLAEDGLAAKVVKAYMDERLVYRVQVGPYEEKDQLNDAQSKLAARGIHGTLRKVGDKIA